MEDAEECKISDSFPQKLNCFVKINYNLSYYTIPFIDRLIYNSTFEDIKINNLSYRMLMNLNDTIKTMF